MRVPFFLDQHIDVFAAVSVSEPVLDFVIAASAMPDRSPIDFRALCDDQHVLWSSWVSYVSRSHGALPLFFGSCKKRGPRCGVI